MAHVIQNASLPQTFQHEDGPSFAMAQLLDSLELLRNRECFDSSTDFSTSETLQNHSMLLIGAAIILSMQLGFALFEAGFTSAKSASQMLFKNMLDVSVSGLVFFAVGYAFAFGLPVGSGDRSIIGASGFFLAGSALCQLPQFLFQLAFATTCVTIVSGGVGERTTFATTIVYSVIMSAIVFPLVAHAAWAPTGWLNTLGYFSDFAGGAVVHVTGGVMAFFGCWMMGPRLKVANSDNFERPVPHSTPLIVSGSLIIFVGFLFFNGATAYTRLSNQTYPEFAAALSMTNTVIAAFASTLTAVVYQSATVGKFSIVTTCSAFIAGCVSVCSFAPFMMPWAALVMGIATFFTYIAWEKLLVLLKVDDTVGAVPVHLGVGLLSTLFGPFLRLDGIFYTFSRNAWLGFGWNLAGCLVIIAWCGLWSFGGFWVLRRFGVLRHSLLADFVGSNAYEMVEQTYYIEPRGSSTRNANSGANNGNSHGVAQTSSRVLDRMTQVRDVIDTDDFPRTQPRALQPIMEAEREGRQRTITMHFHAADAFVTQDLRGATHGDCVV
eukprot:m.327924 g.327924  ORF g.327924 m.327924 type:complete len:550 (+) comp16028_c1_seq1:178-1827(+)